MKKITIIQKEIRDSRNKMGYSGEEDIRFKGKTLIFFPTKIRGED